MFRLIRVSILIGLLIPVLQNDLTGKPGNHRRGNDGTNIDFNTDLRPFGRSEQLRGKDTTADTHNRRLCNEICIELHSLGRRVSGVINRTELITEKIRGYLIEKGQEPTHTRTHVRGKRIYRYTKKGVFITVLLLYNYI